MNILLTGGAGQLGQELLPRLRQRGTVHAADQIATGPDMIRQDLSDLPALQALLDRLRPALIVNAAAYTAVDAAEKDPLTAFRLNAELPCALARWCRRNEAALIHYSTDYVFDGRGERPYRESDSPSPLNVYGQSKLAGEWAVAVSGCRFLVLRTSWVYSTHGKNFVLNMLKLAQQRPELSVVRDQVGCPTWARNLAVVSCQLIDGLRVRDEGWRQTLHYCDDSQTSWHDFAQLIFRNAVELGKLAGFPRLKSIRSAEFPQVARRPAYSVLDTSAIRGAFGVSPPTLETSLRACLEELES